MSDNEQRTPLPDIQPIQRGPQDGYQMLPTSYLKAEREARNILNKAVQQELPHAEPIGKLMDVGTRVTGVVMNVRDRDLQGIYPNHMPGKAIDSMPDAPERERKYWGQHYEGVNLGAVLAKRDHAFAVELEQSMTEAMSANQRAAIRSALELKYANIVLVGVPIYANNGELQLSAVLNLNADELRAINQHHRDLLEKEGFVPQDLHMEMQPKPALDEQGNQRFDKQGKPMMTAPGLVTMGVITMPDAEGRVDLATGPRVLTTLSPEALYHRSPQAVLYAVSHEVNHATQLKGDGYVQFVRTNVLPSLAADQALSPVSHRVRRDEERSSDRYGLRHSSLQGSIDLHSANYTDPMPLWENEVKKYMVNGEVPEEKKEEVTRIVMSKHYTPDEYAAIDRKQSINGNHPSHVERLTRDLVEDEHLRKEADMVRALVHKVESTMALPTAAPAIGPQPDEHSSGKKR